MKMSGKKVRGQNRSPTRLSECKLKDEWHCSFGFGFGFGFTNENKNTRC